MYSSQNIFYIILLAKLLFYFIVQYTEQEHEQKNNGTKTWTGTREVRRGLFGSYICLKKNPTE